MKRVLVTGAAGFIGRHALAPLLARGYEVHGVSHGGSKPAGANVHWHGADLLDSAAIESLIEAVRPTHLLHFAWHTRPGTFWTAPENYRWLESGIALLRHFQRSGGARIVMAGSCAEYEWDGAVSAEGSTPLRPATPYGFCKHALQQTLRSFCDLHGLSGAWGRIFFVYGHGEHPTRLVGSAVASMLRGEPARCTDGLQVRDFLHVEDVANAFAALLDGRVEGAVNIASGKAVTLREVVLAAADELGTPGLVQFGAIPRPPSEPPFLVADVRRLEEDVGFSPRYDLRSGMARAVGQWKAERAG